MSGQLSYSPDQAPVQHQRPSTCSNQPRLDHEAVEPTGQEARITP